MQPPICQKAPAHSRILCYNPLRIESTFASSWWRVLNTPTRAKLSAKVHLWRTLNPLGAWAFFAVQRCRVLAFVASARACHVVSVQLETVCRLDYLLVTTNAVYSACDKP